MHDEAKPRQARVKNKAPAPIQISAEQLLREASERLDPSDPTRRAKSLIANESIDDYRHRNRKFFEDKLRRDRNQIGVWLRYAAFEESQREFARARSIYERALDVDAYNITVFLKYAEMEIKCKHVNMARNVWDRAVTIQPRVDQFWYKYAYMEETLGNVEAARQVYERWMRWEPEETIWLSYIKFERRYKQWANARALFERLVALHPTLSAWLAYARFEEEGGRGSERCRAVFERAVEAVPAERREPRLFIEFARFEIRMREFERARVIYKFALGLFPKSLAEGLYNSYAQFERQFGDESSMSEVILLKRRTAYEERVREDPFNYDTWFDYLRMEEEEMAGTTASDRSASIDLVRELYERAIANVPPGEEKRLWRRYIYLWIYYAVFEELVAGDVERALAVYRAVLDLVPHRKFTFAKLWTMLAHLHLRRHDLAAARKTMGTALGLGAKPRLFKDYIEMEMRLREFDRCRIIYGKYLEYDPTNATAWLKYAELERLLLDEDRARALYELAITQPLDMPEVAWRAYIDFEYEGGRHEAARTLYERLLERTEHIKVWVSYANFESSLPDADALPRARSVLERAYESLRMQGLVTERLLLLEAWRELEVRADPQSAALEELLRRFPRTVTKRRQGEDGEWEEHVEYLFPEDEAAQPASKLLAMAHQWKREKAAGDGPIV